MTISAEYANKPDYDMELRGMECTTLSGLPARILGFSPVYESQVKVGVIAGTRQAVIGALPKGRLVKTNDKSGWAYLLSATKVGDGYLCTYEIYQAIVDMAASPLRRAIKAQALELR